MYSQLAKKISALKGDLLLTLGYRAMTTKFLKYFSPERLFSNCLPDVCNVSLIIVKKERVSDAQHPTWMLKATLRIGVTLFWQNVNVLSCIFSVTDLLVFAFGSVALVWIPEAKKWHICHMKQKRQKQLLKTCSHWAEMPSKEDCVRFAVSRTLMTSKLLNRIVDTTGVSLCKSMQPEIFPLKLNFATQLFCCSPASGILQNL